MVFSQWFTYDETSVANIVVKYYMLSSKMKSPKFHTDIMETFIPVVGQLYIDRMSLRFLWMTPLCDLYVLIIAADLAHIYYIALSVSLKFLDHFEQSI